VNKAFDWTIDRSFSGVWCLLKFVRWCKLVLSIFCSFVITYRCCSFQVHLLHKPLQKWRRSDWDKRYRNKYNFKLFGLFARSFSIKLVQVALYCKLCKQQRSCL